MTLQVEKQHGGEFLLTEWSGDLSRDHAVIVSGQNLTDGAVLGKIAASDKFKEFDPAAVDGSQNAAAILIGDANATAADKDAVICARGAAVKHDKLVWKAGVDSGQKATALAALAAKHIITRS